MSTPSENIDIPQFIVEKNEDRSGLFYMLNPFKSYSVKNTLVEDPDSISKEEDIFSMDDSEDCESSESSVGETPDDWEEVADKKSCCDILTRRFERITGKHYTPLVTYYEIKVDKQWKKAEKIYNEKCTTDNFNQTVNYYIRELFNNIGWVIFGMFMSTTQKVNVPVPVLVYTDCQ